MPFAPSSPCLAPCLRACPQAAWAHEVKPEAVDWEALIAEVMERGKAVPEVDWCKPGEDAAMEASAAAHATCPPCLLLGRAGSGGSVAGVC